MIVSAAQDCIKHDITPMNFTITTAPKWKIFKYSFPSFPPGWIHAEHIEHQRSVFTVIEHAIDSFASHFNGSVVGSVGLWIGSPIAARIRNGKELYESLCFRQRKSCSSFKWKSKLCSQVSVTQYNF